MKSDHRETALRRSKGTTAEKRGYGKKKVIKTRLKLNYTPSCLNYLANRQKKAEKRWTRQGKRQPVRTKDV